ncbi:MAG TPA: hypothetical protein VG271_15100 [Beijerinckiaceae bacterium]|jgi:hypothetical protein|nr:hypothetical protein [Beijerinckiaceae bacterium]
MNPTIRKTLVSGLGALIVTGAFASVPAAARGGHMGGGFFNFGDLASSMMDNSDATSGTVVSTTPLQPYNKPCHNETRKLYDDNDNVVAHQVVMVCPAK